MALIEFEGSEDEFKQMKALAAQAKSALPSKKLLDALGNNPKTRAKALELIKEVLPNFSIPEVDVPKHATALIDQKMKAVTEKLEALEKKEQDEKTKKSAQSIDELIASGRKQLKKEGYSDEGIDKIEKLMQDRGLTDYEAAASLFDRQNPPDEPVTSNIINAKDWGGLVENEEGNPWTEAVKPRGSNGQQFAAIKRAQNSEISKWLQENRQARRGR